MHAGVASSTGMYLTMFTAGAATINLFIFQLLNVKYTLLLCALAIAGSIPGIYMQAFIVKLAGGRTQFTVGLLVSVMIVVACTLFPL